VDILKQRLGRPDLIGPVKGEISGSLRMYVSIRDGIIVNWTVKDRVGRMLWGCPDCGTVHAYYPSAVYDPSWTRGYGDCCERGMRKLFATNELWKP